MKIYKDGSRTTAYLSGEIDHHSAVYIRETIDSEVERSRPEILRLDFADVSFMDSSGIGLVMGRYKKISDYGGKLEVSGAANSIEKVMKLSGIGKIARII